MKGRIPQCSTTTTRPLTDATTLATDGRSTTLAGLTRLVRSADERKVTGLYYVEGIRFVIKALEHGADIRAFVGAPGLLTHPFARKFWADAESRGVKRLSINAGDFRELSQVAEPQGIGAIVRQVWSPLDAIRTAGGLCWIMVDEVQSPGNLGTIFRSCDAVGAAGIIFVGNRLDPHSPNVVRATMGAIFSQRCIRTTMPEFLAWKRRNDCLWVATSPHARADFRSIRYRSPTILWMGGERKGLSEEAQALCDKSVRIPIVGSSDSLNLGVAASVMLYEVYNQSRLCERGCEAFLWTFRLRGH